MKCEDVRKWFFGIAVLFLAVASVAAFAAAGRFGMVNCDDYEYLASAHTIFGVEHAIWMPLTWLSYDLETAMGVDCGMRHWVSILLHAANGVLLFAFLRRIFPGRFWVAAFATFFWTVHPLRVESVAWIASRKDVISTFFFLLALLAWIRDWGVRANAQALGLLTSLALLMLGAAAKPSVMVFPVFVLAIDFLVMERRKPLWAYGAAVAFAFAIAVEAALAQKAGGACDALSAVPLWYRLANALAAVTVYLGNTFAFEGMAPQCGMRWPMMPRWSMIGLALLLLSVGYLVCALRRPVLAAVRDPRCLLSDPHRDPLSAGLLIFLVSLVPFLGIIGFGDHAYADRFTLLPSLGISIALIALVDCELFRARAVGQTVAALAGLAVCAILFRTTRGQTAYWENDRTLFSHTLEVDGVHNAQAQIVLGGYCYEFEHDMERVFSHFNEIPLEKWERYGHYGWMYVESALATGHGKEAEEFFDWLSGWDTRQTSAKRASMNLEPWMEVSCQSTDAYRLANVLRLAFRDAPDMRKMADRQFAEIVASKPKDHGVLNVAYRLALHDGRDGEKERLAAQDMICDDPYMKNRWAFRAAVKSE